MWRKLALAAVALACAAAAHAAPLRFIPVLANQNPCKNYTLSTQLAGGTPNCYANAQAQASTKSPTFSVSAGALSGTGATYATAVDAAGVVHNFASGVARLTSAGLTLEPSVTNALKYSQTFTNGYWSNQESTLTGAAATAPDGTTTATLITSTSTQPAIYNTNTLSLTANQPETVSVYLKEGTGNTQSLVVLEDSSTSNACGGLATLTGAGTIVADGYPYGNVVSCASSIQALANGWYRVTLTSLSPNTSYYVVVYQGNGANSASGQTMYVWGAMLVQNTMQSFNYIPTTSAAVTKAADSASQTIPAGCTPQTCIGMVNWGTNGGESYVQPTAGSLNLTATNAPWLTQPISSIQVVPLSMQPVPAFASSAGLTQFSYRLDNNFQANAQINTGNCTAGAKLYTGNGWYGSTGFTSSNISYNADGSANIGAPTSGFYAGPMLSAGYTSSSPYFCGTLFKGSLYAEADFSFDPTQVNVANGWPAFWLQSGLHLRATTEGSASVDPWLTTAIAPATVATFTFSQATTNVTTTSVTGTIGLGNGLTGAGVASGCFFKSQTSGTTGGAGVYVVSCSETVASESGTSVTAPTGALGSEHYGEPDIFEAEVTTNAIVTAGTGGSSSTTLVVSALTGTIHIGDIISCPVTDGCPAGGVTVTAQTSGSAGSTGNYTVSSAITVSNGTTFLDFYPTYLAIETRAMHDWYGLYQTDVPNFCLAHTLSVNYCNYNIIQYFNQTAPTYNLQFHNYGILINTVAGTIQYYRDHIAQGPAQTYTACASSDVPPPSVSTPWAFCIFGAETFSLTVGGAGSLTTGSPMTLRHMFVLQAPGYANVTN